MLAPRLAVAKIKPAISGKRLRVSRRVKKTMLVRPGDGKTSAYITKIWKK